MKLRDRYSKPGPGIEPGAPRRTGFARWWELVSRDAGPFFMASSLCLLALLPYALAVVLAVAARSLLLLLLGAALGGAIEGPVFCGLVDTVLRSLRDEPGYWWHTWRRAMRQNWRQSLLPGALFGDAYGVQLFALLFTDPKAVQAWHLVALLVSVVFVVALSVWYWPQVALLKLPFGKLLKNSLLLALSHPLQSLGAALCWLVYLGAAALAFPVSIPVVLLTLWVPAVTALLILYRSLDKTFHIEEELGTPKLSSETTPTP